MRTCEQGFHTAAQATVALPPSWFHHIVPPLARDALAAMHGATIEHDTPADARAQDDPEDRIRSSPGPEASFGEGEAVRIIG